MDSELRAEVLRRDCLVRSKLRKAMRKQSEDWVRVKLANPDSQGVYKTGLLVDVAVEQTLIPGS